MPFGMACMNRGKWLLCDPDGEHQLHHREQGEVIARQDSDEMYLVKLNKGGEIIRLEEPKLSVNCANKKETRPATSRWDGGGTVCSKEKSGKNHTLLMVIEWRYTEWSPRSIVKRAMPLLQKY